MVALASQAQIVIWTLVSAQHSEQGDSCQACGRAIKDIFVIRSSTGEFKNVGSECVKFLVLGNIATVEKIAKRFTRAASQWRKQTPAALPNETREQYINRRVVEMGNAWNAYRAMLAKPPRFSWNDTRGTLRKAAERLLRKYGITNDGSLRYGDLRRLVMDFYCKAHDTRKMNAFARKHSANAFDFTNRYASEVKKL